MNKRRVGSTVGGSRGGSDKGINEYRIEGDTAYIVLTDKMGAVAGEAVIDLQDIERVLTYGKWHLKKSKNTSYVLSGHPALGLHKFIMSNDDEYGVDHINHNGLDNRRVNLRLCERRRNLFNKQKYRNGNSPYKGISLDKRCGKWNAQIQRDKKAQYLGLFNTPDEAARAYDKAAKELFGEFAQLNFPGEPSTE